MKATDRYMWFRDLDPEDSKPPNLDKRIVEYLLYLHEKIFKLEDRLYNLDGEVE